MVTMTRSDGSPAVADDLDARIVTASLRCFARWGLAKTTLDDVAREAGCSRATVYRAFPGGKDVLLDAVIRFELRRFLTTLASDLDAASGLEDRVVAAMAGAARFLRDHEAIQYLLEHEPEVVVPRLSFDRLDDLFALGVAFARPYLAPYLPDAEIAPATEWIIRLIVSYGLTPSPTVDMTDSDDVARLVRRYVLPGLQTLAHPPARSRTPKGS
jgi:AcrR family transcriptional regulator